MITRGKDLELQRLRSEVQELSNALYMAWPYVESTRRMLSKAGALNAQDYTRLDNYSDVYLRIALPRVDAGREDAA